MSAQAAGETRPHSKYDRLIAAAKAVPTVRTIVVHPCDETSLRGAVDAAEAGIIKPILVGPAAKIAAAAAKHNINIAGYEIVDTEHSEAAAAKGGRAHSRGQGRGFRRLTAPSRSD
jgi:phosphate acetyltransferase